MIGKISGNLRSSLVTVILSLGSGLVAVSFMLLVNLIHERTILSFALRSRSFFLLSSPANILLVERRDDGELVGLITLHDLIRAQVALEE